MLSGSTTYTPAPRGRRVRGDVCYLHSGPEREACAWHHILLTPRPRRGGACAVLYATYTPAPRGRCVRGAIRYLHSGPDRPRGRRVCRLNAAYTPAPNGRRVCGTASALPPAEPRGAAARREWTAGRGWTRQRPMWRRLDLPGRKRDLVGWAVRRVARPWASMDNTRELGWMLA